MLFGGFVNQRCEEAPSSRLAVNRCSSADSVIGSVEWALADRTPPILIVVGNSNNDIVATAVQHAMGAGH